MPQTTNKVAGNTFNIPGYLKCGKCVLPEFFTGKHKSLRFYFFLLVNIVRSFNIVVSLTCTVVWLCSFLQLLLMIFC